MGWRNSLRLVAASCAFVLGVATGLGVEVTSATLPETLFPLGLQVVGRSGIEVTVATHQKTYFPGERIRFDVTAYNTSDLDMRLGFPSSLQARFFVDGIDPGWVGACVLTERHIAAHESFTWSFAKGCDYGLGLHHVVGDMVGYRSSAPIAFEVVGPPPVTSDVFINFDELPDGEPSGTPGLGGLTDKITLTDAYAAWGVHFRSIGAGVVGPPIPGFYGDGDNIYASIMSASCPSGFNIVADFDMPVYAVSAEVASAKDVSVRMVAKDTDGRVVGSITSAPMSAVGLFTEPLRLESATPIASVEFWPSNERASVSIDNLFLSVPEPSIVALLAAGAAVLLTRCVRRKRGHQ